MLDFRGGVWCDFANTPPIILGGMMISVTPTKFLITPMGYQAETGATEIIGIDGPVTTKIVGVTYNGVAVAPAADGKSFTFNVIAGANTLLVTIIGIPNVSEQIGIYSQVFAAGGNMTPYLTLSMNASGVVWWAPDIIGA
jgi:hypothetical protein